MKYLSILLFSLTSIAYADNLTVSPGYVGNDAVKFSVLKQSQQVVNRDRRHESASAIILGVVKPYEGAEIKPATTDSDNKIIIWEGHDVDHGLGEGLIINDPAYYVPAEQSSLELEVNPVSETIDENSIKPETK